MVELDNISRDAEHGRAAESRRRLRQRRLAWARGAAVPTVPGADGDPHAPVQPRTDAARTWSVDVAVIERERIVRGWTQRELACRAQVDPGTLCDLLGRRRRSTFGTVQAICAALGLTLAQAINVHLATGE